MITGVNCSLFSKRKIFPNKEFVVVLELHFCNSYGRHFLLYGNM